MAYVDGAYRFQVRGHNGTAEVWNNTFTAFDPTAAQNPQEVATRLRAFYSAIHGETGFSGSAGSDGCTIKDLFSGISSEASWAATVGAGSGTRLPPQLAVRISLRANSVDGGPFLSGFTTAAVETVGPAVDDALIADIATSWNGMVEGLTSDGWVLHLDRPSVPGTLQVTQATIGNRFDVIRKRANDLVEERTVMQVA